MLSEADDIRLAAMLGQNPRELLGKRLAELGICFSQLVKELILTGLWTGMT